MTFQDIATTAAAKLGWKAKVGAVILMLSTFTWSLISIGIATTSGTWGFETFVIVIMLNAAEMVGASWVLTPVLEAVVDGDQTRAKLKTAIQILWGSTVWMAYLAEFTVVALGSWEKFANLPSILIWQVCRFILTFTIAVITAFGTDFSVTLLMASTGRRVRTAQVSSRSESNVTKAGLPRSPNSPFYGKPED